MTMGVQIKHAFIYTTVHSLYLYIKLTCILFVAEINCGFQFILLRTTDMIGILIGFNTDCKFGYWWSLKL